jgi:hypothetical protein
LLAQNLRTAREAAADAKGSDGMTPTALHIFAINGESDLRHTNLTRAQGLAPDLPALEDWLGVDTILTDQIEVFPHRGSRRHEPYRLRRDGLRSRPPPGPDARARLDALEGSVLLVPDTAMPAEPETRRDADPIAVLPLAAADHNAELPKADMTPAAPRQKSRPPSHRRRRACPKASRSPSSS